MEYVAMAETITLQNRVTKVAESAGVEGVEAILKDMLPKEAAGIQEMAGNVWDAIKGADKETLVAGAMPLVGAGVGALAAGKGKRLKGAGIGAGVGVGTGVGILALRHLIRRMLGSGAPADLDTAEARNATQAAQVKADKAAEDAAQVPPGNLDSVDMRNPEAAEREDKEKTNEARMKAGYPVQG